jgi:hypothetical protein
MMSSTTSAVWSRSILSLCCTEHSSYRGAALLGRITSIAMSRSGQLDRCCTIETHCSSLHVLQALQSRTSMPWKHVSLAACLGQLGLSLFVWSIARRGPWDTWQHWSSPLRKAEPEAMRHVAAPELTSSRRQGLELRDMWQRQSSPQQGGEVRGRETHGDTGSHLCREV